MSIIEWFVIMVISVIVGTVCYYMGYTTGTEREHDRLFEQWLREKREDSRD